MKLAIGCDEAAYRLKVIIMEHLKEKHAEIEVTDFGVAQGNTVLYPNVAYTVADAVASGGFQRGILLCGTGIGMAIAANKVDGIRAANIVSPAFAALCREHNDANVITLSGRFVDLSANKEILKSFLSTEFGGGRHAGRVEKIMALEG